MQQAIYWGLHNYGIHMEIYMPDSDLGYAGLTLNDKVIAKPLMSFQTFHRENQWGTEEHDRKLDAKREESWNRKDSILSLTMWISLKFGYGRLQYNNERAAKSYGFTAESNESERPV